MTKPALSLPILPSAQDVPMWQGLRPAGSLPGWDAADASPEPQLPQGEYEVRPDSENRPGVIVPSTDQPVELMAPAGGPDAAFAALQHGADAIYLGLKKFSARAEAENFTLEQLGEVTAYAHALSPRRRVYVTVNTLIRQDELPELIADLAALADIGVDAVIVQDLGAVAIAREHFPELELHASTQMAVHNRAGAQTLNQLGMTRVVLARELTLEEIHDITATAGIETEVFVHGALCYAYSGLCLFSSQTLGRSGNRGKCAYSCRDSYEVHDAPATLRDGTAVRRDPRSGFPFSMKDLALPDHLPMLRAAGVSCVKIEGRKKSPLYVATTTSYYRGLLDQTIPEVERSARQTELQTVFSRPWTRLFVQSHKDKEVADRDTVGHRGALIGQIEQLNHRGDKTMLGFTTSWPLEWRDGLQVDLPTLGKPFGFPVDDLWMVAPDGRKRAVYTVPAGARIEVGLPLDHPDLIVGMPVYCSSSQLVKQKYRYDRPKAGYYRPRHRLDVAVAITPTGIDVVGRTWRNVAALFQLNGEFPAARTVGSLEPAVRTVFEKLGETEFFLGELRVDNPAGLFVPVSTLNKLRRGLIERLGEQMRLARQSRVQSVLESVLPIAAARSRAEKLRWSIKTDRLEHIAAFTDDDWVGVDELILDIARDHPFELEQRLEQLARQLGRERIRLALPAVTRKWEEAGLAAKISKFRAAGWNKWEAANVSAWAYLGIDPNQPAALDLATDWSIYVLNRAAALAVMAMGAKRFALSPEDGRENLRSLLGEFPGQAVLIVYQDTPVFIAESCAYANLIGGCPGKANCRFESMAMESSHGERVTAIDYHCRTIVLNDGPYCLAPRLPEIIKIGCRNVRADFIYRRYQPNEAVDTWRAVRAGRAVAGGHAANFERGLQ